MRFFGRNSEVAELRSQMAQLQATVADAVQFRVESRNPKVNPYPTYSEQVTETARKYLQLSSYGGCGILANIIDVRAAFIAGQGVKPVAADGFDASRELEFLKGFIAANNLEDEVPQDLAREAEIEGKILLRLIADKEARGVRLRWVPWLQHGYEVKAFEDDYARFEKVQYRLNKTGRDITLLPKEFVYARLGGQSNNVNDCPSKAARVLRFVESLDKALIDWREINHLFAAPTPVFKCKDYSEANDLYTKLQEIGWTIGKFIACTGDYSLVGPSNSSVETLREEITTLAKMISGGTGVPVHFLGLPDLMSNRSTADNLMELVQASTSRERKIWAGTWEEVFRKALALANEHLQGGFNPEAVSAAIPELSAAKMKELSEVWLPIRSAGEISRETFLGHIPELDVKEELKRLDGEKAEAVKTILDAIPAMTDSAQTSDVENL